MRQKYRAAVGEAPDDNVQIRSSYHGVFRFAYIDWADGAFGPVRYEDRNSRKVRAKNPGRRVRDEDRIRETFRRNRGQDFRRQRVRIGCMIGVEPGRSKRATSGSQGIARAYS